MNKINIASLLLHELSKLTLKKAFKKISIGQKFSLLSKRKKISIQMQPEKSNLIQPE